MLVAGEHRRTIELADDGWSVEIIDQTKLPFAFETVRLRTLEDAVRARGRGQVLREGVIREGVKS